MGASEFVETEGLKWRTVRTSLPIPLRVAREPAQEVRMKHGSNKICFQSLDE